MLTFLIMRSILTASFPSFIQWFPVAAFALCGIATLLAGRQRVQGTTFVGPWSWAIAAFAFATVGAAYMAMHCRTAPNTTGGLGAFETLSFAMATLFFCPVVSVLGAKRPQHNAWHLIVASLWMVLVLPAAETALIRQGWAIQIHDARAWFLWALIAVTFLNYVFTRYVAVATCCCAAIIVWLSPYLPGLRWEPPLRLPYAAMLFLCGLAAYYLSRHWKSPARYGLDKAWIDFRDTYGITWGLRVMERVNTAAAAGDWPAKLEWDGFKVADEITDEQRNGLQASFVGILRRFTDVG